MTFQEFSGWVGGGTAAAWALAKIIAYLAESLGLRPSDRRADRLARVEQLEREVTALRGEIDRLREELREERERADYLERILRRGGYIKTDQGYEGEIDQK